MKPKSKPNYPNALEKSLELYLECVNELRSRHVTFIERITFESHILTVLFKSPRTKEPIHLYLKLGNHPALYLGYWVPNPKNKQKARYRTTRIQTFQHFLNSI